MASVLRDDGIAIHVIPSPFWKLCHIIGFYPNAVLARAERLGKRMARRAPTVLPEDAWDNNPKSDVAPRPYLARLLWPAAHGASGSNLAEFRLFGQAHWREMFCAAGFRVAAVRPGPVSSGYGFGWDAARRLLERWGATSEYIYITVKAGQASDSIPRLRYVLP
jgi:hypothetical protein